MQPSESGFTTGLQCHRRLWWTVHERDAPELWVDASLQVVFYHGSNVGEVARGYIPGVLIDLSYNEAKRRKADTRKALESKAKVIYEASFKADEVFVSGEQARTR